jgi:hypothetical protein
MDNRGIVRDSSIWSHPETKAAYNRVDGLIRVGIVKGIFNDADTGELRYLVGVNSNGREIDTNCVMLRRFGGVYNYEDYIGHGYNYQDAPDSIAGYNAKAGDAVLVGQLNGQGREGVIIGGLTHAARTTTIQASAGPQYDAEFNGMHTSINTKGEWTLTFKGQPTNLAQLNDAPSQPIPAPIYDLSVGGSYMKFDMNGGWTVADAALSNPQSIVINKAAGTLTLTAGAVSIAMTKSSQEIDVTAQTLNINASNSLSENTGTYSLNATTSATITSPMFTINASSTAMISASEITLSGGSVSVAASSISMAGGGVAISLGGGSVAIGSPSVNLITELIDALTALGNTVIDTAPNAPAPLNSQGSWAPVAAAISALQSLV